MTAKRICVCCVSSGLAIRGYEIENRFLHSSGEPHCWFHRVVTALEGEAGRATYLMALVTNVTESRRPRVLRGESEERLRLAVEAGDLGVWEYDPVTDVSIRSLRHDQMFGYSEAQSEWGVDIVLGHLHPDDRQMFKQAIEAGLETGGVCCPNAHALARWQLPLAGCALSDGIDSNHRPSVCAEVIADVTDRVRAR